MVTIWGPHWDREKGVPEVLNWVLLPELSTRLQRCMNSSKRGQKQHLQSPLDKCITFPHLQSSVSQHFWEHFWLQTTFFGFTKGTMSWTLMSWKILGWVPLCSYTTTIWPTGAADRVSSISSWALPASWMPTGTGERERFFALSPISCLRVNEGHLATTQSNYLKEVRSLSSFFILFS